MKLSESPIMTFIRGTTLLAVLIALPGIAVCWNHLPKGPRSESTSKPPAPKTEKTQFHRKAFDTSVAVSSFAPESIHPPLPEMPMEPAVALPTQAAASDGTIRQVSWEHVRSEPPQDFESLALHLKTLGATYYRLEKWGNRGELFRFSCFVTPLEPYSYEKHFQAIGADAVTVMRSVITEIEQWKKKLVLDLSE